MSKPTDLNLLNAFQTISYSQKAKAWVGSPRRKITDVYLEQLAAKRVLRCEFRKALGLFRVTDWFVVDRSRQAAVRRRLDAITTRTGSVGIEDRALAGLAYAAGLGDSLYAGRAGREQRHRLKEIARPKKSGSLFRGRSVDPAPPAIEAAVDAAGAAAISAAVDVTVDLAVQAAVNAAIDVTIDAGGHDGGAGHGGGHGGGH